MQLTFDMLFELEKTNKEVMIFVVEKSKVVDLKKLLKSEGIKGYSKLNKADLVKMVIENVNCMAINKVKAIDDKNKVLALDVPPEMKPLKTKWKKSAFKEHYFSNIWNKNQLKNRYKFLCNILHPDKGGNQENFNEMKEEYDVRNNLIGYSDRDLENVYDKEYLDYLEVYFIRNMSIELEYANYFLNILKNKGDKNE